MSARPSEIKALAELLDNGEFESSKDAAKALINELDRQREDRVEHVVVCIAQGPAIFAYGGYATADRATAAVMSGKVPMAGVTKTAIGELRSAAYAARSIGEL